MNAWVPICALCKEEIHHPREAWKRMSGWVSPHGAKAMTATRPTGEIAHASCVSLVKADIPVGQGQLL